MAIIYIESVVYFKVYSELINAAKYHGVVTYQPIARVMGVPERGGQMAGATGRMLGVISRNEVAQGRPMLSAIAVGVSGFPGDGFFVLARELGFEFGGSKEEKRMFWESQCKAVYEIWK
jgi:hypothetical protein